MLITFYLFIALAALAKGPIGILLPLMVVVCFLVFRKEWDKINRMRLYFGVPIAIAIVLAWYIPATHQSAGYDFGPMVKKQIIGRIFHPTSHSVSISYWPFFHFKALATGMFPWSFLIPPAIVAAYQSRRCVPLFFLFCWVSVIFVFFTIIASKRDLYILPMYPATAALIALWVLRSTPAFNMKLVRAMSACLGIFVLVIVVIAPAYLNRKFHGLYFHYDLKIIVPLTIAGMAAMAAAIFGKKLNHIIGLLSGSMLIFLMTIITIILPQMNEYKSARNICNVYNYVKDSDSEIAMFGNVRTEYVFYTKEFIRPVQNINELKGFFCSNKKMFCLLSEKDYKRYEKVYNRLLDKQKFPIYIVIKKRVGSRIMVLLCNHKLLSPTFN